MGHKVNPDIYRLGVSKTWVFQLRSNKNFIKNLFLFKFLRNLFMNYTVPFFDFKNRRNQKINDKLVLRGEDQLVSSPFVKNNLLFSHVYFGSIKNKLFVESFFIDVAFKQVKKKYENTKKIHYYDIMEFKPWNALYYKKIFLKHLFKLEKKSINSFKRIFSNRIFKSVNRKSTIFKLKFAPRISKEFYFFFQNVKKRHNRKLFRYLDNNYKFFYKKICRKNKLKRKYKISFIKIFKKKKKKFEKFGYLGRPKIFCEREAKHKKSYIEFKELPFFERKLKRLYNRNRIKFTLRYLRKVMKFNTHAKLKYRFRNVLEHYRFITLPKLLRLISISFFPSKQSLVNRRALPKNPLFFYDLTLLDEKKFTFYKNFNNLKILKYFIRCVKFTVFFPIKKRIFFCQTFINLMMNYFGLANSNILTKKMYLLLQIVLFYSLSFSFLNFLNFKKHFFSRFVFFKGVSKTVYRNIIEITKHEKLYFNVVGQNKFRFNSSLVLNYILIKLGQYFTIHEIVNPLSFYIKNLTSIAGYKILITGRLTRKERAAVMIRSGKRMPLSTIKANIDYSAGFKIMKFGLVGIKVYLLLKPSALLNLYRFQYNFN